jgi:hypothetical protein
MHVSRPDHISSIALFQSDIFEDSSRLKKRQIVKTEYRNIDKHDRAFTLLRSKSNIR